jgi:hypothetical protein
LKQWLADNAIAWAASRGLQIASAADEKNPGAPRFVHLPISLLPLPFPKSAFDEAVEVAPVFNLLVDRVSRDNAWLKSTLSEVSIQMGVHAARQSEVPCPAVMWVSATVGRMYARVHGAFAVYASALAFPYAGCEYSLGSPPGLVSALRCVAATRSPVGC